MLTDLEAVFRSLKSELGLRPVRLRRKEERTDGHLFITVPAYQLVQIIRRQLREKGIHDSWSTLRKALGTRFGSPLLFAAPMTALSMCAKPHARNVRRQSASGGPGPGY